MNAVCIIIGIIFLIFVLVGWIQGFFRVAISLLGLIASILIAVYFAPQLSNYVQENTLMDEKISLYILEKMEFANGNQEESKGIQVSLIQGLPLPDEIKENMLNNNNSEMYEALHVKNVYDYIAKSVAMIILNVIVFLSLLLVARVIFYSLIKAAGFIVELPILRWMDKIGGGCIGAVMAVIYIWIFFLILSITSASAWSCEMIQEICQFEPLKLLYENNILLDIVGDLTKVLFR